MTDKDDSRFSDSLEKVRNLTRSNDLPNPNDDDRKSDTDDLDYLLNHYEFLSAAIWCGDIDERLMKSCEESRLTKLFTQTKTYIDENRRVDEQPSMWENLEKLVDRWGAWPPSTADRVYEFSTMRPCQECPNWLQKINGPVARVTDWGTRVKLWRQSRNSS
jgi:hypothetical protein